MLKVNTVSDRCVLTAATIFEKNNFACFIGLFITSFFVSYVKMLEI